MHVSVWCLFDTDICGFKFPRFCLSWLRLEYRVLPTRGHVCGDAEHPAQVPTLVPGLRGRRQTRFPACPAASQPSQTDTAAFLCVWSLASSLSQCGERAGRSRSGEMNYSAPAKCQAPHWVPHVRLTEKRGIDHEAWGVLDLQTQTLEPDHWNFNYKLCHSFPTY